MGGLFGWVEKRSLVLAPEKFKYTLRNFLGNNFYIEEFLMADYLRDKRICNVFIDENAIKEISSEFLSISKTIYESLQQNSKPPSVLSYIIRFDNKGYRFFSPEDLLHYFYKAHDVERLIFSIETKESLDSNRLQGTWMELRLDKKDLMSCILSVTSNNKEIVDNSFLRIQEILKNYETKNGWVQTIWTRLLIQITGIFTGFLLSLWSAVKISPMLTIQNSFIICFLLIFLVFSNIWTYLNNGILTFLIRIFPSIKFYRQDKDKTHWLTQAIIGGVIVTPLAGLLILGMSHLGKIIINFINSSIL